MIDIRLRRTRWILGGGLALVALGAVLLVNSRQCAIVVYNETAQPLSGLSVMAPGFIWRVKLLEAGESRSTGLPVNLAETTLVVHQGRAGDRGHEVWFEAGPGRRLILRIWPDGTVEADRQDPWWE